MKQFLACLPDDLYDDLKEKAKKAGISMAEVVRQALTEQERIHGYTDIPLRVSRWTKYEFSHAVKQRDNCICQKCGIKGDDKTTIAHHIIPLKFGGRNILNNGETLCVTCHRERHLRIRNQNTLEIFKDSELHCRVKPEEYKEAISILKELFPDSIIN